MKTTDFITEHNAFIAQDAGEMHTDHEVQMARADCYHAADYAIKLHKILAQVGEGGELEGWVSEKITLANDYLRTVYEYLSYEDQEVDLHAMPTFAFESAEAQLQAELKEANPHNFDSDVDYYAAQNAPAKPRYRGTQSPGVNPDDEDYFREIFRKKREAAKKAEQDKQQGVAEARASSASFRQGNAQRAEVNAMSPEERKAHEDKRAEQQRKRDDARMERERQRNAAKKGVAEGSDNKVAKHNAAVAKLPGGQAHKSNHPDLLKSAPKGYSFSVSHKLVPDKQTVSEMTAGGTGAGAVATGPAGGTSKPGTGKPKKLGNIVRRTTPKIGTGIYK